MHLYLKNWVYDNKGNNIFYKWACKLIFILLLCGSFRPHLRWMKEPGFQEELDKLGQRIRKIRKARGMTLVDLEVACGIHDTDLSRIERGLESIEYRTVFKIATGLGVTTSILTDYDAPIPPKLREIKKPWPQQVPGSWLQSKTAYLLRNFMYRLPNWVTTLTSSW